MGQPVENKDLHAHLYGVYETSRPAENMPDRALTEAVTRRPPMPVRAILGAVLAGIVVAALVALDILGAASAPDTQTFRFTRNTTFAPGEEMRLRGFLTEVAENPELLIRITGHTGLQGAEDANTALSEARAQAAEQIAEEIGIPAARILSVEGVGGGRPTPRDQSQAEREWERAQSRVTVSAQVRP